MNPRPAPSELLAAQTPRTTPRVSVIVPMEFSRGKALECIEGWTKAQTFPKEDYQIIVAAPQTLQAAVAGEIRKHLRPWDRLEQYPHNHDMALAAAGARLAAGEWLLFTESHCLPEPHALMHLLEVGGAHPDWAGFSSATTPITHNFLSRVEAEMYDRDIRETLARSSWLKVMDQCFMIRRQAYFESGGFEAAYGHFAEWLLSATLTAGGYRMGVDMTPVLRHYYVGDLDELAAFTTDFALGHIRFSAEHPQDKRTDFFPLIPELEEFRRRSRSDLRKMGWLRLRTLPASNWRLCRRFMKQRDGAPRLGDLAGYCRKLANETALGLLKGLLGLQGACAYAHWAERRARKQLGRAIRREDPAAARNRHLDWFMRLVHASRLRYLQSHASPEPQPVRGGFSRRGKWNVESLGAIELHGFHAQESAQGRTFRWSAHCAAIHVPLSAGRYRVKIEWDSVRLLAHKDLLRVELNGRRVGPGNLDVKRTSFEIPVSSAADAWHRISWAVLPFPVPADERLLGLPVFGVEWSEVSGG